MSDQSQTTDGAGVTRTATGEIADQSNQTTQTSTPSETGSEKDQTQEKTEESTKTSDGKAKPSLLNDGKKEEAPAGAPEKYEAFKMPEGYEWNEEGGKEVVETFKKLNLNQDQAQSLVDLYNKNILAATEGPVNFWLETQEKWVAEIKVDPDIGGPKLDSVVKPTISKAIDILGDKIAPAFREAMDFTGAGNNPAFVKGFFKFAQLLTEGQHVGSGGGPSEHGQNKPGAPSGTGARAMYPNLPSASGGRS